MTFLVGGDFYTAKEFLKIGAELGNSTSEQYYTELLEAGY